MIVERFAITDIDDCEAVDRALARVAPQPIACNNWSEAYPYAPTVSFRMLHCDSHLVIRFDVAERWTMARVAEDNGRSWTDSCVEFFFSPEAGRYYNFEFTCIGRLLLSHRTVGTEAENAPAEALRGVIRHPSLGSEPFEEREGDNRWSLTVAIPASSLFADRIGSWRGLRGTMNLYKCGDELSQPHFLSWRPIEYVRPQFHLPEFFGGVEFE